MDRRGFLKNSIGALLFGALSSNKVLSQVVETLTPTSPKVLLYLIQTKSGVWKVKATKWVDLYKQKRLKPCKVNVKTFKVLDIVDYEIATQRKFELWKQYNCSGRLTKVKILEDTLYGQKAIKSEKYIQYRNSDKFKETLKKRNDAASHAIRNMDDDLREQRRQTAKKHITGRKHSEQTKQKLKEKFKGRSSSFKGKTHSEDAKKKMSEKKKGKPSHNKGKTFSIETRKRMSEGGKGKKLSKEHKEKIKQKMLVNPPFKGKKHTTESKIKILQKHPSKIKTTCEHCSKQLDYPNYKRYHGDKCKFKIFEVFT